MKLFLTLLLMCLSVASSVAQTTTTVNLTWNLPTDDCAGNCPTRWYFVYAGTQNDCATTAMPLPTKAEVGGPGAIVVVNAPATSFTYSFPTGTAVCWEITAGNNFGESTHSNRVTLTANPSPTAPAGLRVAKL